MYALNAETHHMDLYPNLADDVLHHIITPYVADSYDSFLARFNLTKKYPDLLFNLRHGFPIGDMPPLTCTYTPKNHKSAADKPEITRNYCKDKVKLRHMSGLSSKEEVHHLLGGHFISSPLGLVEKSGKYRIVRDLLFENEDGYAINNWLDTDDFPTEWGTAAQITEIVSHSHHSQHDGLTQQHDSMCDIMR